MLGDHQWIIPIWVGTTSKMKKVSVHSSRQVGGHPCMDTDDPHLSREQLCDWGFIYIHMKGPGDYL